MKCFLMRLHQYVCVRISPFDIHAFKPLSPVFDICFWFTAFRVRICHINIFVCCYFLLSGDEWYVRWILRIRLWNDSGMREQSDTEREGMERCEEFRRPRNQTCMCLFTVIVIRVSNSRKLKYQSSTWWDWKKVPIQTQNWSAKLFLGFLHQ